MNTAELRKLSNEEIVLKIQEEKDVYNKMLLSHRISPIENPIEIRKKRRFIARLSTVLNETK